MNANIDILPKNEKVLHIFIFLLTFPEVRGQTHLLQKEGKCKCRRKVSNIFSQQLFPLLSNINNVCIVEVETTCPLPPLSRTHFWIILWPQLQGRREVDRAWDSCKALCYVANACWNSQINGRGSSPNQSSIPDYILGLWAVVHSGRHQYLLLPWHSDRQDQEGGSHFGPSHLHGWLFGRLGKSPFLWPTTLGL